MHICRTLDGLVLQLDIEGAVKGPMCNCVKNIDSGVLTLRYLRAGMIPYI